MDQMDYGAVLPPSLMVFFLSDSEACFVGSHVEEGLVKVLRKPSLSAKRQSDNVTWDKVRISEEKCDK